MFTCSIVSLFLFTYAITLLHRFVVVTVVYMISLQRLCTIPTWENQLYNSRQSCCYCLRKDTYINGHALLRLVFVTVLFGKMVWIHLDSHQKEKSRKLRVIVTEKYFQLCLPLTACSSNKMRATRKCSCTVRRSVRLLKFMDYRFSYFCADFGYLQYSEIGRYHCNWVSLREITNTRMS